VSRNGQGQKAKGPFASLWASFGCQLLAMQLIKVEYSFDRISYTLKTDVPVTETLF